MMGFQRFSGSALLFSTVWTISGSMQVVPMPAIAAPKAEASTVRESYKAVPLSSLKGSLMSGDPNQLPLLALSLKTEKGERQPQVVIDRSNPNRIVAIVTRLGVGGLNRTQQPYAAQSSAATQYRIEMVKNNSLCSCQQWKVDWVGQK
jgi:hypothetical protein